jgi:hypothetical protein
MAAYGWIVRKFIRDGEVTTEKLATGGVTPVKMAYNTTPTATALVDAAAAVTVAPGLMYTVAYSVPAGNAKTYKFALPFKCEILDIEAVKAGANASAVAAQDTLTFKNGVGGSTIAVLDLVNSTFAAGVGTAKVAGAWGAGSPVIPAGGIIEITTAQTVNCACSFTLHLVASP